MDLRRFEQQNSNEAVFPTPETGAPLKPPSQPLGGKPSFRQAFTAFKYRNYRLWFLGQSVSLFGTWMQSTAQGFLIFQLTRSPAFLGYVGFAAGIPTWLFTLYGGVVADRMARRTLLVITQTTMMVLAFILAALAFLNFVQPWHIILLAFCLGVANSFDAPARQAFVSEMVKREDLTNAIALNATMFNLSIAVGPAVSGVIYALFGPGWCFTINGLSFIAVIVALLLMKLKTQVRPIRSNSTRADLREGIRYVLHHSVIRTLICLVAMMGLFGITFLTLMPAWAVKILGGNAATNGWLQSARGVGALSSALLIASLGRFQFKGRLLTVGTFAFPILMLVFAVVRWIPLSLLVLVGAGGSSVLIMNLANALVQTHVRDSLRGRVMGIYTLLFFGMMPLGSLWMGAVAQIASEPTPIIIGGLTLLSIAISVYIFAPRVRHLE
jgi:MFS family permease